MTTDNTVRSLLVLGRSQLVIDDAVLGLRDLGYSAQTANDFANITGRYDVERIDLVASGGRSPGAQSRAHPTDRRAINPHVISIEGLAGIPGPIVNQRAASGSPGVTEFRARPPGV